MSVRTKYTPGTRRTCRRGFRRDERSCKRSVRLKDAIGTRREMETSVGRV